MRAEAKFINDQVKNHIEKAEEAFKRMVPWVEGVNDINDSVDEYPEFHLNTIGGRELLQPFNDEAVSDIKTTLQILLEVKEHRSRAIAEAILSFGRGLWTKDIPAQYLFPDEYPEYKNMCFSDIAAAEVEKTTYIKFDMLRQYEFLLMEMLIRPAQIDSGKTEVS